MSGASQGKAGTRKVGVSDGGGPPGNEARGSQVGAAIGSERPEDRTRVEEGRAPAESDETAPLDEAGDEDLEATIPRTAEGAASVGPEERELTSVNSDYGEEGARRKEANESGRPKAG